MEEVQGHRPAGRPHLHPPGRGGPQLPGQPLHGPARLCRQLCPPLIDVGAITRSLKKEYEHLAQKKEMDWDAHFNNLTALVRAAGVAGAFSRRPFRLRRAFPLRRLRGQPHPHHQRPARRTLRTIKTEAQQEAREKVTVT